MNFSHSDWLDDLFGRNNSYEQANTDNWFVYTTDEQTKSIEKHITVSAWQTVILSVLCFIASVLCLRASGLLMTGPLNTKAGVTLAVPAAIIVATVSVYKCVTAISVLVRAHRGDTYDCFCMVPAHVVQTQKRLLGGTWLTVELNDDDSGCYRFCCKTTTRHVGAQVMLVMLPYALGEPNKTWPFEKYQETFVPAWI